jgi:hypothetical protein
VTLAEAPAELHRRTLKTDIAMIHFDRHFPDDAFTIPVPTEVRVKGTLVAHELLVPTKYVLVPPPVRKAINDGFSKLEALVEQTVRFPIRIAQLRTADEAFLEGFVPRWEAAQAHLAAALEGVRQRWPAEVEQWAADQWEATLGDDYAKSVGATLKYIRLNLDTRYSMQYTVWQVPTPLEATAINPDVQKWLDQGKENAVKVVEAAFLEMVTGTRDALADAFEDMAQTLVDPQTKVIRPGSFTPMRKAMDKFRALRDLSDAALLHQINNMEARLDELVAEASSSPLGFTNTVKAKGHELQQAIAAVVEAAKDEVARAEVTQRFRRRGRGVAI